MAATSAITPSATILNARVFAPGRTLNWNALTRHATGEALNAKAFAAEIDRE